MSRRAEGNNTNSQMRQFSACGPMGRAGTLENVAAASASLYADPARCVFGEPVGVDRGPVQ